MFAAKCFQKLNAVQSSQKTSRKQRLLAKPAQGNNGDTLAGRLQQLEDARKQGLLSEAGETTGGGGAAVEPEPQVCREANWKDAHEFQGFWVFLPCQCSSYGSVLPIWFCHGWNAVDEDTLAVAPCTVCCVLPCPDWGKTYKREGGSNDFVDPDDDDKVNFSDHGMCPYHAFLSDDKSCPGKACRICKW